jgi:hypothetical protein
MTQRAIVVDANILIRAVLGVRVRQLITEHVAHAGVEAWRRVRASLARRGSRKYRIRKKRRHYRDEGNHLACFADGPSPSPAKGVRASVCGSDRR